MEYYREPNNRIQAGFALHAGKLLAQYSSLTANLPPTAKYEATLTICVLQSLLTNCIELLNAMRQHQRAIFSDVIPDIPHRWGIKCSFIKTNSFPPALTYAKFLEHLRNALSHPTSSERGSHPSTGYTTLPDSSDVISFFRFTDSPWVDRGRIHSKASSSDEQKVKRTAEEFERSQGVIGLKVIRNSDGRYEIFRDRQIYFPIFEAELPLVALVELTIGLANHLAQPTVENWNGKTIHRLVA